MAVITFDVSKVLKNIADIPKGPARRAIVRGLNKTAANVRTSANRAIRERRPLPARAVNDALAIRRATANHLVSSLVVTGRPIPLKDYQARPTKAGVTVSVTKGARKLVQHKGNKGFVVEKIGSNVFAREGKARLPIKKLFGPSLPSTFIQAEVRKAWTATAIDAMPKRLAEEMRFELSKLQR